MAIVQFPKTIGSCIDLLKKTELKRKKLDAEVAELKADEQAIADHITSLLKQQRLTTGRGALAQFTITKKKVYAVDWDKLWPFVLKTKNTSLIQKRLGQTAYNEAVEAGINVPGVDVSEIDDYSLTAVKAKVEA